MPISHLEHFLIVADDLEKTVAGYVDVLGFHVGASPDIGVPVRGLYLGDGDVIHVALAPDGGQGEGAGREAASREEIARGGRPIHHVAFRATGLAETLARLERNGVEHVAQQASAQDLYQVFVRDPKGIVLELDFAAQETARAEAPRPALTLGTKIEVAPPIKPFLHLIPA